MSPIDILNNELMNILGLQVNSDGKIYDAEKFAPLIYNNGYIFAAQNAALIHSGDTIFSPISDAKLAKYLFGVLLSKEAEDNDLYLISYGTTPDPSDHRNEAGVPKKFRGEAVTNKARFTTDYFYYESLILIQLMYAITGTPLTIDLHACDTTAEAIMSAARKK